MVKPNAFDMSPVELREISEVQVVIRNVNEFFVDCKCSVPMAVRCRRGSSCSFF